MGIITYERELHQKIGKMHGWNFLTCGVYPKCALDGHACRALEGTTCRRPTLDRGTGARMDGAGAKALRCWGVWAQVA